MIVQKFGGTSVGDGPAIAQLAAIVREAQLEHPVVVASAMGDTTNWRPGPAPASVERARARFPERIGSCSNHPKTRSSSFIGRAGFARGAVWAGELIAGRTGVFEFGELLSEVEKEAP